MKPSDEEIVHKRRNAVHRTTGEGDDGIDDDLRIMLVVSSIKHVEVVSRRKSGEVDVKKIVPKVKK